MPTVPIPLDSAPVNLTDADFHPGDVKIVLMAANDLAITLSDVVHHDVNGHGTWSRSASPVTNLDRLHTLLDDLDAVSWRTRHDLNRVERRVRRRIARRRATRRDRRS